MVSVAFMDGKNEILTIAKSKVQVLLKAHRVYVEGYGEYELAESRPTIIYVNGSIDKPHKQEDSIFRKIQDIIAKNNPPSPTPKPSGI